MMKRLLFFVGVLSLWLSGYSQTYTFTPAGAIGQNGPTQAQVNTAYAGTNLAGMVTSNAGVQYWVVPSTGTYTITALGAQGFGAFGGRGASLSGDFMLTGGDTLKILVGQKAGTPITAENNQYGGGGGTFITTKDNTPLIIAGGGGGSHATAHNATTDASIATSGNTGANGPTNGAGGTAGSGGATGASADGGAGLLTNGGGTAGGKAFVNGGLGGFQRGIGGFGGGGGTSGFNNRRSGGGGGYSGGGGAGSTTTGFPEGGGGGSYNSGINPVNLAGVQLGDGSVIISALSTGLANDAGVIAFNAPVDYCPGPQNATVTIQNFGSNQITSVTVNWSVNGVVQTPFNYTGVLDTFGGLGSPMAQVTVGSFNFPATVVSFKAWTSSPNGAVDGFTNNDTLVRVATPGLVAPTGLTAGTLTSTTALFNWNTLAGAASYKLMYGAKGGAVGSVGSQVSSTNSHTLTGLTGGTFYDVYIVADCGSGVYGDTAGPVQIFTQCSSVIAPYANNFDADAANVAPLCWSVLATNVGNTTANVVQTYTPTTPNSLPNHLRLYNGSNTNNSSVTAAMPPVLSDLTAGNKQIEFYAKASTAGEKVLIGTLANTTTGISTFDTITTLTLTTVHTFYRINIITANGYNGVDSILCFLHGNGATFRTVYLDDFSYRTMPLCSDPISFAPVAVFSSSAQFSVNGTGTSFDYEFGAVGHTAGSGTIQTGGNPSTITGLLPSTNYDVYVRQNCTASGDGTSPWVGPVKIKTGCLAKTLPYTEDFNVDLGCMQAINGGTSTHTWMWQASGTLPGNLNGTGYAIVNSDGAGTAAGRLREMLESPVIDASTLTGSLQIQFSQFFRSIGNDTGAVEVFNGTSWVRIYQIINTSAGALSTPNIVKLDATQYANANFKIRFVYDDNSTWAWYWLVDDLSIMDVPCLSPISFAPVAVFGNSAQFTVNGSGTSYDYEFGPVGHTAGTGTIQTGGSNYTITGLTSATNYDVFVRRNCTATGNGTSSWIGPISIKTACTAKTLPYTENFNTDLGCMLPINGGATTHTWMWQAGTALPGSLDGTGYAIVNSDGAGSAAGRLREYLESPSIDASALTGSLLVKFSQYFRSIGNDTGAVEVFNGTSWVRIYQTVNTNVGAFSNPNIVKLDASQYANANFKVRFLYDDNATFAWYWLIDNFSVSDEPCLEPLGLTATGVTSSTMTIGSGGATSATYQIQYDTAGFTFGSGRYSVTSATNPQVITGLLSNTLYDVYVRKVCAGGLFSAWSGPLKVRTLCTPFTAPYVNGFDNDVANVVPLCWRSVLVPSGTTLNAVSTLTTGTPNSAPQHLRLYNGSNASGTAVTIAVTPEFSDLATVKNKQVEFFAKMATGSGSLIVGTMSDPSNGNTFSPVDTIAVTATYNRYFVDLDSLSAYNGVDKFIGFKHGNTSTFSTIYIDNFNYRVKPACQNPFGVTLINSADSSATFGFGNSNTSYQYNWGPIGFSQGTGIVMSGTGNPLTITGLTPGTGYHVYFRTNCSANGGGFSGWEGPFTFFTTCAKQSLPFVETFNTQPSLGCMQAVNGGSTPDTWVYEPAGGISVTGDLDGTPFAIANSDEAGSGSILMQENLITPPIDASNIAGTLTLEWDQFYQALGDKVEVFVWNGTQWISVWSSTTTLGAFGAPNHQSINITAHANPDLKVKFYYDDNSAWAWWWMVDNIKVRDITCPASTNFALISKTFSSASFSWTASPTSVAYKIEYGPAGFTPGSGTKVPATGSPSTINGLAAGTLYDFYLIDSCAAGKVGYPVGPLKVMTDCAPTSTPFTENFDGASWVSGTNFNNAGAVINPCWTNTPSFTGTSIFYWGTRNHAYSTTTGPTNDISGSGNFVYVESSYGVANDLAYFSTPYIDISSLTTPSLSFFYHMFGSNMGTLRVDVLDGNTWVNGVFTLTGQQQASATAPWLEAYIPLTGLAHDTIRVRFTSIKNGTNGDMAIDQVSISNGVSDDLMILSAAFDRNSPCLTTNDTINFKVVNNIGAAVDFSVNPLVLNYNVSGPLNTTGSVTVNTGTLPFLDTITIKATNINMSIPGEYTLDLGYISSNPVNQRTFNDTLGSVVKSTVYDVFNATPDTIMVTNPNDTFEISVRSPFLSGGKFFITEVCHFKTPTGAPASGWPTWLLADDYIEITGVPGSDLDGYILEQWSATALMNTFTFGPGTIIGPNGTAIIAVGQPGTSVPSPANFYYHGNVTSTFSSGGNNGRILKDASDNIVDAVGVGTTFTFPASSGVTAADWSGNSGNHGSMAGVRLIGADVNSATNWVLSSTAPQDPNIVNAGVQVPFPASTAGFSWTLNGGFVDSIPTIYIGPFTNGIYKYVASYNSACGLLTDTVVVIAGGGCTPPSNVTGTATCDSITLNWSNGTGSNQITYGTGTVFNTVNVTGNSFKVGGLLPGVAYTFAVRNVCSGVLSNPVGTTVTTANSPLPVPSFIATDTVVSGSTFAVTFNATSSTGAGTYTWNFGNGTTGTGAIATATYATPGTYTVTLTVTNACGSATSTFTYVFFGLDDNTINRSLNVYPNPASDNVTITFDGATTSTVIIRLMDASGREMMRVKENVNGSYSGQLDVSRLAKGIYLLEIEAGELKAKRRLSVN